MVSVDVAQQLDSRPKLNLDERKSELVSTDVGIFPADWELKELGEIGQPIAGLTYSPSDVRADGTLVLRSSNVQNGRLAFENNVFVQMNIPERAIVKEGDILICVRNGSRELIGKCAQIDSNASGMAFGAFMGVFRSSLNGFVFYAFQSEYVQRQVREHLGATINQITSKSLKSFKIALPTNPKEASLIAEALANADQHIFHLEQLIDKKRSVKNGVMQELLAGKRRLAGFCDEWKLSKLGELGTFIKGSGVKKDDAQSGEIPCIRYGEIYTLHDDVVREFFSRISSEVAGRATRLQKGDILFAGSGETKEEIGKCVAFVDDFEAYAGGDIVILRTKGQEAKFLGYALNRHGVQQQKAAKGQGDAVVHISAAALGDIELSMPGLEEQSAIAQVADEFDRDLFVLEKKLEKAMQIRFGMMQNLLTGKVRLV